MVTFKKSGQATVEYIFILAIAVMLAFQVTQRFADFFKGQIGKVGHVLSTHLIVGICPTNCFYSGYENGHKGQ